jgi:hypothetical protein
MTLDMTAARDTQRSADALSVYPLPSFDMYGLVHKGLRWQLCELLTRMAAHDAHAADTQSLAMILDDLEGVLYMCVSHGSHEDAHYHPALEARRVGSSLFLHDSHAQLEQDMTALQALSAQLSASMNTPSPALFRTLYLRYGAFVGRNLTHMAEEEQRAQTLFDALYTSDELAIVHATLLRAIGPEEKLASLRAMLRGVNPAERLQLLDMAHALLPAEIWSDVLAQMRTLPEREWRAIELRYA